LHVVREFNAAADSLASETLECKKPTVVSSDDRVLELMKLNRIAEVIYESQNEAEASPLRAETSPAPPNEEDIDPLVVQEERRRRIATAQDKELRWSNLKAVLRGDDAKIGYRAARDAWKMADQFVLSEDDVLYYTRTSRRSSDDEQAELKMRLVVPTTMIQEVLQSCHDSLEGGH
ncbi:hypothetical protein PHYSODRAFT_404747, partial [Phytophthora sojae]